MPPGSGARAEKARQGTTPLCATGKGTQVLPVMHTLLQLVLDRNLSWFVSSLYMQNMVIESELIEE